MKKFFICILMAAVAVGASAQGIRYGVEGGLNVSSPMNADGTKCGFNVGVNAQVQLKGTWYIEGALKLSSKPFSIKENYYSDGSWDSRLSGDAFELTGKADMTPYYLNIPIHAGYKMALGDNLNLSLSAGPYFGIGLWGKGTEKITIKGNVPAGADIEPGEYKVNNVFKDSDMRRFEIGVGVKAGLEFMDHYRLSVGYDIQLNSMMKSDDYYNQVVSVTLGYTF